MGCNLETNRKVQYYYHEQGTLNRQPEKKILENINIRDSPSNMDEEEKTNYKGDSNNNINNVSIKKSEIKIEDNLEINEDLNKEKMGGLYNKESPPSFGYNPSGEGEKLSYELATKGFRNEGNTQILKKNKNDINNINNTNHNEEKIENINNSKINDENNNNINYNYEYKYSIINNSINENNDDNKNNNINSINNISSFNNFNSINNISKDNGNDIITNKNYDKFVPSKDYYLICPECDKNILNIESIKYDSDKKDFIVNYKCFCDEKTPKFFYHIISDHPSYCENHRNELKFLKEESNTLLCEECLEAHKDYKIKNILNKEVIPEEIMTKINEQKDEFKGFNIIRKIYEFYASDKNIEIIAKHNKYNKFQSKEESSQIYLVESQEIDDSQNIIVQQKNEEQANKNSTYIIKNSLANIEELKSPEKDLSLIKFKNSKTLKGHKGRVSALTKLSNGLIASGSYDGTVKIWDITKEEKDSLIMSKNAIGSVFCLLEFEPGFLLGGTSQNMVNLWDLNDKGEEYIHNFYQHYLWVNALVKCDKNHFASASNDSKIIIWDYKNRVYKRTLEGHNDCIMAMIMLRSGYLCSASSDEDIRIWDWKKAICLNYFRPHPKYVKCLLELRNENLITGSEDNTIRIWKKESENYEIIKVLKGHELPVRTLCYISENYFASGSFDDKIKIWDLKNYKEVQTLKGHTSNVICVIKYNEDMLISCSSDKTIRIWEAN